MTNKPVLTIDYDPATDIVEIEGIKYSGQFFRDFARDLEQGQTFSLVSRDDGIVCVKRVFRRL